MYAMKGRLNRAVTSRNTVNPLFFATTARFFSVPSAPVCTRSSAGSVSSNSSTSTRQPLPMRASTQNVMRQSATCSTRAPTTGANTGPMTNMTCTTESTTSRLSTAMASFTTAVDTALEAPAPRACRTRVTTSIQMSNAMAHSTLATT